MTKRTIGVVTVGRSDYGLYVEVLRKIVAHPDLALALHVSGAHFSPQFGNTIEKIEQDGFSIAAKVPVPYKDDTPFETAHLMGAITQGFGAVFRDQRPDILLVLGDRYEMHAAALAAVPFNIPIAHIHGGELTYGAIDEYFRHSMTKLSHLHFATTEVYGKRIVQMGEEPWRVTVSGAPGIDSAISIPKFSREELTEKYGVDFSRPILLTTFHPVTLEYQYTDQYILNLFKALSSFPEYSVVFTYPNADATRDTIINHIEQYTKDNPGTTVVKSFGHQGYLSMMTYAAAMVGNSSSGIIEAASFKLPVVNIGTRQEGRVRGKNVIDVGYTPDEIVAGIKKAFSPAFRESLADLVNPYGDGKASERIVNVLATVDLGRLIPKRFHDIM